MTTTIDQDTITLHYSLYDLPTAQHKAGLAGLTLLIELLEKKQKIKLEGKDVTASKAFFKLKKTDLEEIFNYFFAAEIEVDEKGKERFQPKAQFLADCSMPQPWIILWRDVVRGVLRAGAPAQLNSFKNRAKGKTVKDWENIFVDIVNNKTLPISSTYLPWLESKNAEQIELKYQAKDLLLLLFWPVVSFFYISRIIEHKKNKITKANEWIERNSQSYIISIPEVADLIEFVDTFPTVIAELNPDLIGKRPKAACIRLPEESGLSMLSSFFKITSEKLRRNKPITSVISSAQIVHLQYAQGSPEILALSEINTSEKHVLKFERISNSFFNPFFRNQLIRNTLHEHQWFYGMDKIFSLYPSELFCFSSVKDSSKFWHFGRDSKYYFDEKHKELRTKKENFKQREVISRNMPDLNEDKLAHSIFCLIKRYVSLKSEQKSGVKFNFNDFKQNKLSEKEFFDYKETREKICTDAFLAMRGRRDADFVEYFTGTICSVPHYLPEEEFIQVGQALLNDWETVKTLSMLALSAHSYLTNPKKETEGVEA